MRRLALLALAAAGVATTVVAVGARDDGGYGATLVFPDAANLVAGSRVQVGGLDAGRVTHLSTEDGHALVRVSLSRRHAPLHAGTQASIHYKALLGERIVTLEPGPEANAALPDGALIEGGAARVELDQVLEALDTETREHLRALLPALAGTLAGREADARTAMAAAGPALGALTEVVAGVGQDGPALRRLLTNVAQLSQRLNARRDDVARTVDGLASSLDRVAAGDDSLRRSLDHLPATVDQATATLTRLPATVDRALGFVSDLAPAAARLPGVAADLRPLVTDLRPTLTELRPALTSLSTLLHTTPGLLDRASGVLPGATALLDGLLPAIDFLRPYTPEAAGFLSTWGSAAANYDGNGHYARIFGSGGPGSFNRAPTSTPAWWHNPRRAPGALEDQPWTDANGSEMR